MATMTEENIREKIARKLAEQGANAGMASKMREAVEPAATGPAVDPYFAMPADDCSAGKVLLSSLVPTWDHTRGTYDPYVQVFTAADHAPEHQAFVPAIRAGYRPNQESLAAFAYAIEYTDTPAWLSGDPSVGKSSLVEYFAAITGRPFRRINFNGQISTDSILGKQSLTTTEHGTQVTWHDGIVTEAVQIPHCVLLLDEPTAGPAEVQLSLQYMLERGGRLLLLDKPASSGDSFVIPATGQRTVMADNTVGMGDSTGRFIGTQPQNSAWLDRVGTFITVDWLAQKDEVAMLRGLFPAITDKLAQNIVRLATLLRKGMQDGKVPVCMSMRVTQAWCQHACNLRDVAKGFELAYLNRFDSESDREAVKEVYRNIFG